MREVLPFYKDLIDLWTELLPVSSFAHKIKALSK